MTSFNEAANQHGRIWNAILAPSWDAARATLQAEPDSSLEVHVQELFDTMHNMGRMQPKLLFTCVDAILNELGNHVSIEAAASLRNSIRTSILPWAVIPRVLRGDLSMNEADVAQVMDSYHWPFGSTRDHVQQLLLNICHAMQGFRTVMQSEQATEEQRQFALEALHNIVQQVLAEHGPHLLPGMADDLLSRVHDFAN
jgi:hypothetical protein